MKNRILETRQDRLEELLTGLVKQNPCPCGGVIQAEYVVNRFWRGVIVKCNACDALVAEIDDPEEGWT